MYLLKLTSVEDLPEYIADTNSRLTEIEGNIATINGPVTQEGSLAWHEKNANDYTDNAIQNVDLSQVEENRLGLVTLNGDKTVENSVDWKIDQAITPVEEEFTLRTTELEEDITENKEAIDVLNGPSTLPGSINHAVQSVIGVAPENLDTFGEIAEKLLDTDDSIAAVALVVSDNKVAADAAIVTTNENIDNAVISHNNATANATTSLTNHINTSITDSEAAADAKFLKVENLFSEFDTDVKKATARTNIGALSTEDVDTIADNRKPVFKSEDHMVVNGKVTLPAHVTHASVFTVRLLTANRFAYDEVRIVPGANPGDLLTYDSVEGDLDGISLRVHYADIPA